MQKRHLITINVLFFGSMLFVALVVFQFLTGNKLLETVFGVGRPQVAHVTTSACSEKPELDGLTASTNNQVKRLASYQEACHSFVSSTLMTFFSMPISQESAVAGAKTAASTLKAFAAAGVRPLVIAEPSDDQGDQIDFAELARGAYDPWLDAYFKQLKAEGITDQQMGIWNPLPEANLPYWNNNQPEYFAPIVNRYLSIARKHFPNLQSSILLNSATYETTDFNWENGDYQSLLPYIKGITPGTINYVGLQGFPWAAPKGGLATIFNASEFLNPDLLTEMADKLKIKNVWVNTGTFGSKYALDPSRTIAVSPEQRKQIMTTIETQVLELKTRGYNVSVNIFAKDKSHTSEETNWSYWAEQPFTSSATPVFTEFASSMFTSNVDMWLFDD